MQPICVEYLHENLGSAQVKDICEKLHKDYFKAITLRECVLSDRDYKRILKWVGESKTLRHLSLNIGVVPDTFRVQVLAQALQKNQSLTGLFVHGNEIGDGGIKILQPSLLSHPHIVSLDVGDCGIGDDGLEMICQLLIKKDNRPGLEELVLSSNPEITGKGWAKLGVTVAAGCHLRTLYIDFNELGDSSASCLLVAVASMKSLQTLDMECVGATDSTAQRNTELYSRMEDKSLKRDNCKTSKMVLLHLVQNYSVSIQNINLDGNEISPTTIEAIRMYLPGLKEDGINSDEEHSLATSEPPLDQNSDLEDLNSPVNCITIVGATDSPAYTPDVIVDKTEYTETHNVIEPEIGSQTIIVAEIETQSAKVAERDRQNVTAMDQLALVGTETPDVAVPETVSTDVTIKNGKLCAEAGESQKGNAAKRPAKAGSLADRIKSQRDANLESSSMTVIPVVEKEAQEQIITVQSKSNNNLQSESPFLVRRKGSIDMISKNKDMVTKLSPKVESVEEVEDIEEMDEAAINTAHDNLKVPDTPSKMSLCSGPGVKSTSSIFDDTQMMRLSPSSAFNRQRRYSHNIEIKQEEKQNLQGIARHRASDGNINPGFSNRRDSVPSNARLTVHGVGSSADADGLQADNTRRRLSCASTLGDVDIEHFH